MLDVCFTNIFLVISLITILMTEYALVSIGSNKWAKITNYASINFILKLFLKIFGGHVNQPVS